MKGKRHTPVIHTHKARKDYICNRCGGNILKGTKYNSYRGWDGNLWREHFHAASAMLAEPKLRCNRVEEAVGMQTSVAQTSRPKGRDK